MIIRYLHSNYSETDYYDLYCFEIKLNTRKKTFSYKRTYRTLNKCGKYGRNRKTPEVTLILSKDTCKKIEEQMTPFVLAAQLEDSYLYDIHSVIWVEDLRTLYSKVQISKPKTKFEITYAKGQKPLNNPSIEVMEMFVEELGKIIKQENITLKVDKLIVRRKK